jgi:hypothetical protein
MAQILLARLAGSGNSDPLYEPFVSLLSIVYPAILNDSLSECWVLL